MRRCLAMAASLCVLLLLGACTDPAPKPPPPPSPGPTMPPESPTPSAKPSTPSASEQKHGDLLAVQHQYKLLFDEEARLLAKGGTTKPTRVILQTTSGEYQQVVVSTLKSLKTKHEHVTVPGKLLGVSMASWTPTRVTFYGCEDFSHAKWVRADGSVDDTRDPKLLRNVQTLKAVKRAGQWRIDSIKTSLVSSFKTAPCNGRWYA